MTPMLYRRKLQQAIAGYNHSKRAGYAHAKRVIAGSIEDFDVFMLGGLAHAYRSFGGAFAAGIAQYVDEVAKEREGHND